MLKKTITFKDLDGNPLTEDFYFQLDSGELAELQLTHEGGFAEYLQKINEKPANGKQIMSTFKDILRMSVGKRGADNVSFIKTEEITNRFMFSNAYSVLFMEIVTNANAAQEFIRAVVPADLVAQVEAAQKKEAEKVVELPQSGVIEGVAGDAAVQKAKPQPTGLPEPTPFPNTLEQMIQTNTPPVNAVSQSGKDDDPPWLQEGRNPTRQELIKMSKEDMQLVFKMREAGLIS